MIKVENLSFKYENRLILDDINFEIKKGEKYALVGRNGAGKSTLIKLLLNLQKQQEGRITIADHPQKSSKWKDHLSYLPEKFTLYRQLTGLENMEFLGNLSKRQFNSELAEKALSDVRLDDAKNLQVKTYSKGMSQRLGLATIIYQDSDIIILDEPTSGLDPMGRKDILEIIKGFTDKTILMSSHHFEEVRYTCDHVLTLEDKKIKTMTTEEFELNYL